MGQTGSDAGSRKLRRIAATHRHRLKSVQPEQRKGECDGDKEHGAVFCRLHRGNGNLRPFRQADLGGGHVMTSTLHGLILGQPAMHDPGKDRQQQDE